MDFHIVKMYKDKVSTKMSKIFVYQCVKLSEVNVKDTFTSHIDKQIFLTFLLTPYLYTFSLYENPSFIIFSAETKCISTQGHYSFHSFPVVDWFFSVYILMTFDFPFVNKIFTFSLLDNVPKKTSPTSRLLWHKQNDPHFFHIIYNFYLDILANKGRV
jgi:hypothetical protein